MLTGLSQWFKVPHSNYSLKGHEFLLSHLQEWAERALESYNFRSQCPCENSSGMISMAMLATNVNHRTSGWKGLLWLYYGFQIKVCCCFVSNKFLLRVHLLVFMDLRLQCLLTSMGILWIRPVLDTTQHLFVTFLHKSVSEWQI